MCVAALIYEANVRVTVELRQVFLRVRTIQEVVPVWALGKSAGSYFELRNM